MKLGKKDIIIIILTILIIIVFIAIILSNKEKSNTNNYEYKQFDSIDISNCYKKSCNEEYKFNNNNVKITQDNDLNYQVRINGKNVLSGNGNPYLEPKIYVFDNDMIISTYSEETETMISYLYDSREGFDAIRIIEDDPLWFYKGFEVKDNIITYNMSRFSVKDTFEDIGKKLSVKIDNCVNYTKYKDTAVFRTYESKYENGKFTTPTLKKETLLKDYNNYSKLCN